MQKPCEKKYECPKCASKEIKHHYVKKSNKILKCDSFYCCDVIEEHFHHSCLWCHYEWTEIIGVQETGYVTWWEPCNIETQQTLSNIWVYLYQGFEIKQDVEGNIVATKLANSGKRLSFIIG